MRVGVYGRLSKSGMFNLRFVSGIFKFVRVKVVHSGTLPVLNVAWLLSINPRRKLLAKSSKRKFGRPELGFLGHRPRVSRAGVPVDPRKVQAIP